MDTIIAEAEFIDGQLSRAQVCRLTQLNGEQLLRYVDAGIVSGNHSFDMRAVQRIAKAQRLERDLGVNLAGAALALELLDEIDSLKRQLARLG